MDSTVVLAERNGKSAPAAIGASGVVQYGGVVNYADYDRSWTGFERDKTIQRMLNDPVIGAALSGAEMVIRRVDWRVDPADESEAATEAAEFVQSCFDDMRDAWPGDTLARVLTYLGWGWSTLSIGYKLRRGLAGDQPSRFDDGRVGWDEWMLLPQATRYGWEFDTRNRPTALVQQDPQTFKMVTVPLARCLHLRYGARDNSPEGATPLRVAFDAWYKGNRIEVIEGITIEREGAGLPVIYMPDSDINGNTPSFQMAQKIVTGLRTDSQAGVILAGNRDASGNRYWELELLSTGGQRAIDTAPVVARYDNKKLMVFQANVMKTGQDAVGSYALSETQGGLWQQGIGAHLDIIANAINEQVIPKLMAFNGIDPNLTPILAHGDVENADLEVLGGFFKVMADAGVVVDSPELRKQLHDLAGLPTPPLEEIEADMAEEERKAEEAERMAQEMAKQANVPQRGARAQPGAPGEDTPKPKAEPTKASEARQGLMTLVESEDDSITLSTLVQIVGAWDRDNPEAAGMLNARLVEEA